MNPDGERTSGIGYGDDGFFLEDPDTAGFP